MNNKMVLLLLLIFSFTANAQQRILVQPRHGLSQGELDKKLASVRGKRVDYIHQIDVHIVELPDSANARAAAAMLNGDKPDINFAEVDERVAPTLTPNDPGLASEWYAAKLGAQTAWDSANGSGVIVAVLDSGVDGAHPDLAPNIVAGYNFYDNNTDTRDVYGHGTKVAGTVAMAGNNLIGGTGIGFGAQIMPIRVTDTNGFGYYSAIAKGITWSADNGAKVANMSFSGVCGSSTIDSAAKYMRSKGGVVTASAGNSGGLEALAASDNITCVSATDSTDNRASWSSYGSYVDVAAPGVGIYTTVRGATYGSVSGTSFSAPITAAVYALMMSVNRTLTPSQFDSILFSTAHDLGAAGKDEYYGSGRIDAAAAVTKAYMSTTQNVSSGTTSGGTNGGSTNVALASAGAVATASSAYSGYPVTSINDNQRSGANWGNGGGWNDATNGTFPDWVQINFGSAKSIDRVVVYTVQDNYTNPVEPTDTMTFSRYGVVDFTIQGWNGSSWISLASVTGNNLVKRTVSFAAFTTNAIRIVVSRASDQWSRLTEVEAWSASTTSSTTQDSNLALASAGGVATASSAYPGYPVSALNDNQRSGANWGNGGGWNDATYGTFPDWVQINFSGTKSINRLVVYTVQDNYTNPVEPTDTMTFSRYGVVDFTVQGWNGSSWISLANVTGNNLVKRTVSFPAITTNSIRVVVSKASDQWSRLTEIEAWGQ